MQILKTQFFKVLNKKGELCKSRASLGALHSSSVATLKLSSYKVLMKPFPVGRSVSWTILTRLTFKYKIWFSKINILYFQYTSVCRCVRRRSHSYEWMAHDVNVFTEKDLIQNFSTTRIILTSRQHTKVRSSSLLLSLSQPQTEVALKSFMLC